VDQETDPQGHTPSRPFPPTDATDATDPTGPTARWFDGRSPVPRSVFLRITDGHLEAWASGLHAAPDGAQGQAEPLARWPAADVDWPERQRHGAVQVHLPDGGLIEPVDADDWSAWITAHRPAESAVVRWQQSWRLSVAALVLLVAAVWAGGRWGVPAAAQAMVPFIPAAVTASASDAAIRALDGSVLSASRLPAEAQARLTALWQAAERKAVQGPLGDAGDGVRTELLFRKGGRMGANALALPDGRMLLTDEMVAMLADRDDVLIGVLGHERGHVRDGHGMRLVVQTAIVGVFGSLVVGDFSTVLAAAPGALAARAYSRDMEREADAAAVELLQANGLKPEVMVTLFERLAKAHGAEGDRGGWSIALASHPADAERIAFFRQASR
jgi:Zn-dependent protease with chaperone function